MLDCILFFVLKYLKILFILKNAKRNKMMFFEKFNNDKRK